MVEAEARGGESMRRKSTPSRSRESRGDENAIETAGKFSVQTPSINLPINRPDVAVGREGSSDSDRSSRVSLSRDRSRTSSNPSLSTDSTRMVKRARAFLVG